MTTRTRTSRKPSDREHAGRRARHNGKTTTIPNPRATGHNRANGLIKANEPSPAADSPEHAAARDYLTRPQLLPRIVEDLQHAFSISGENELLCALYLAISSRKLDDPVSLIVRGPSGSGKSFVIDRVCELVPPDDLLVATHLSPKALYYGEQSVAHKVLNGKERSRMTGPETEERTAAIRQLLSDKRIINRTVREGQGVIQVVEGPVAYVESTTRGTSDIFDEDLTRCLLLETSDDPEHRRRVLTTIGGRFAPDTDLSGVREKLVAQHRVIQGHLLQAHPVRIPFHERLADGFPVTAPSAPRLFERLLFTVATSAHLHQFQRQRDTGGGLLATMDDYRVARSIVNRSLLDSLTRNLNRSERTIMEIIRRLGPISRSDLAKAASTLEIGRTHAYERLDGLLDRGIIVEVHPARGSRPGVVAVFQLPDLG